MPERHFQDLFNSNKRGIRLKWQTFTAELRNQLPLRYQICSGLNVCLGKLRISMTVQST